MSEICSVCKPESSVRSHKKSCIDSVAVFIHLRMSHLDSLSISKIRRIRIKGLVPHGKYAACMSATKSTTCSTVSDKITVTDLNCVRSCTAARSYGTAFPCPTVSRNKSAATGSESVIFAVALYDRRRIVNKWLANLGRCVIGNTQ